MHKSQWRTVATVAFLAVVLLAGFLYAVRSSSATAAAMFPHFALAVVGLAGFVATKAAVQHLAGAGGGIKGAAAALFTATKPETTEAQQP